MRFKLGRTLIIGPVLLALFLVIGQGFCPSWVFGDDKDNAPVVQQNKDIGRPIAGAIKEMRKAYLNPLIVESHGLDREQATAAACPPAVRASGQTASTLGERVGSGTQPKCVQSCMKGQSFDDAHAVLLCSSRCL